MYGRWLPPEHASPQASRRLPLLPADLAPRPSFLRVLPSFPPRLRCRAAHQEPGVRVGGRRHPGQRGWERQRALGYARARCAWLPSLGTHEQPSYPAHVSSLNPVPVPVSYLNPVPAPVSSLNRCCAYGPTNPTPPAVAPWYTATDLALQVLKASGAAQSDTAIDLCRLLLCLSCFERSGRQGRCSWRAVRLGRGRLQHEDCIETIVVSECVAFVDCHFVGWLAAVSQPLSPYCLMHRRTSPSRRRWCRALRCGGSGSPQRSRVRACACSCVWVTRTRTRTRVGRAHVHMQRLV